MPALELTSPLCIFVTGVRTKELLYKGQFGVYFTRSQAVVVSRDNVVISGSITKTLSHLEGSKGERRREGSNPLKIHHPCYGSKLSRCKMYRAFFFSSLYVSRCIAPFNYRLAAVILLFMRSIQHRTRGTKVLRNKVFNCNRRIIEKLLRYGAKVRNALLS